MALLRRSFTPPVGSLDLYASQGNCRFETPVPGRDRDWLRFKYVANDEPEIYSPSRPRRALPDSVLRGGASPRAQRIVVTNSRSTPPSLPRCCGDSWMPKPPPRVSGGTSGLSRMHERLLGESARGIAARADLHHAIAGSNVGRSRWSDWKVLYTQLVDAINGDCIEALLSSIAQVEVAGMIDWPEYTIALERLSSLQKLMGQLESAAVSTDVSEVKRALDDARLLSCGLRNRTKWAPQDAAERRLEKLHKTEVELNSVANGSSIPQLVMALRCAHELGISSWPQSQSAEIRLKALNVAHKHLCDAVGGENQDDLLAAETFAVGLGVTEQSDLPLGSLLGAVRERLGNNVREPEFHSEQPDRVQTSIYSHGDNSSCSWVEEASLCSSRCSEVDAALERMVKSQCDSMLMCRNDLRDDVQNLNSPGALEIMHKDANALLNSVLLHDLESGVFDDMDFLPSRIDGSRMPGDGTCQSADIFVQSTRHPSTTPGLSDSRNSACRPDSSNSYSVDASLMVPNNVGCDMQGKRMQSEARDHAFLMVCQAVVSVADTQSSDSSHESS